MKIIVGAVILLFLVLWVRAVIDVVRRGDLTVGVKAGWAIAMLFVPFMGLLVYTMLRRSNGQIAQRSRR